MSDAVVMYDDTVGELIDEVFCLLLFPTPHPLCLSATELRFSFNCSFLFSCKPWRVVEKMTKKNDTQFTQKNRSRQSSPASVDSRALSAKPLSAVCRN